MNYRPQRRLSAIIAVDVVGYTRLMAQDEAATLDALKRFRQDLIDPKVTEHSGRVVKTTGDGLLLEFPSAVSAALCAIEVQLGMRVRNAEVAADRRVEVRMGINIGDVVAEGEAQQIYY